MKALRIVRIPRQVDGCIFDELWPIADLVLRYLVV